MNKSEEPWHLATYIKFGIRPEVDRNLLFPRSQLARVQSLDNCQLELEISGRKLKPVTSKRLLGIEIG